MIPLVDAFDADPFDTDSFDADRRSMGHQGGANATVPAAPSATRPALGISSGPLLRMLGKRFHMHVEPGRHRQRHQRVMQCRGIGRFI